MRKLAQVGRRVLRALKNPSGGRSAGRLAKGRLSLRATLSAVSARVLTARSGRSLSASQLWRILTDAFYAGTVTYRGECFPGRYPPLVSEETFRQVREGLDRRRRH